MTRRQQPPLDTDTMLAVHRAINTAKWNGESLPERLHRDGLLWTPDREAQLRAQVIEFILNEMRHWEPREFLRKVDKGLAQATPTDMYMAIRQWLEEHLAYARSTT